MTDLANPSFVNTSKGSLGVTSLVAKSVPDALLIYCTKGLRWNASVDCRQITMPLLKCKNKSVYL